MRINRVPIPRCAFAALTLLLMCSHVQAQTVTLTGQLVAEDSLQPLPHATITATSYTRPLKIVETTTTLDGRFTMEVTAGYLYRLCSGATSNYADTCRFAKPIEVRASAITQAVRMTAPVGIRMRVRIIDADGLLRSLQDAASDPVLLHVFADESITRTRMPLQIVPSATVANAFEAATVIPTSLRWDVGMSSVRAQLYDGNGSVYQSNNPIPRPASYGVEEFLAVFTLRAK